EQAAQPQVEQAAQPQVEQAAQPQVEQAAQPQVEQAAPAQEQAAMTILKNTLDQVQQWNLFVDNRDNGIHYLWVQLNDKIYSVDSNNCYAVYDETTQQWSDMGITATENSSAAQRVSQLLRTPPKDA
ncbi:MAG: hypothetical protein HY861_01585, partial [Chlamydiia bacterium]|nr:hypothetical protein [Chlamydiia bacterium]